MKNKKEFPRKRKRFIRKIIFYSSFFLAIGIVLLGFAFYSIWSKLHRPLYISPLSSTQIAHADQEDLFMKQIVTGLKKKQINFTSISRQDDAYIVTLQDKSKVTFSSQKDIMSQIASSILRCEKTIFKTFSSLRD